LRHFAKDLETNLKSENRKEERKEKYELDPWGNDPAQHQNQPAAHLEKSRMGTFLPLLSH
jgi:hypothetical protein